mmetsp:Transcript_109287/g.314758  ORF Transcript_109287/g.314758 Transcript_109287/m.314758 type:complete len:209 (-) Transcript_109287:59-685(-)
MSPTTRSSRARRWYSAESCAILRDDKAKRTGSVLSNAQASMMKSAGFAVAGHDTPVQPSTRVTAPPGAPLYMIWPSERSKRWSNALKMSCRGWWMEHTTVQPCCACCRNRSTTTLALAASKPDVGSSAHKSEGRWSKRMARLTRRRSPPEMPLPPGVPTRVPAHRESPRSATSASATPRASATRRRAAENRKVSRTVRAASNSSSCGM